MFLLRFFIIVLEFDIILNRFLVEIIISSCLCVGVTEYKNLIIF